MGISNVGLWSQTTHIEKLNTGTTDFFLYTRVPIVPYQPLKLQFLVHFRKFFFFVEKMARYDGHTTYIEKDIFKIMKEHFFSRCQFEM